MVRPIDAYPSGYTAPEVASQTTPYHPINTASVLECPSDMVLNSTNVTDILGFCVSLVENEIDLLGVGLEGVPIISVRHKGGGADLSRRFSLAAMKHPEIRYVCDIVGRQMVSYCARAR